MAIQPAAPQIATPLPGSLTEEAIAVRGALLDRGLETPMTTNDLSRDQRYDVIRDAFGDIMRALGLDLRDDSLEETPHRIAKMYVDEVFSGLNYSQFPKITVIEKVFNNDPQFRKQKEKMYTQKFNTKYKGLNRINNLMLIASGKFFLIFSIWYSYTNL